MSNKVQKSDKFSSHNDGDDTDSEDHLCPKENANNYKGVFYNDDNEHKFYEFGAHFQYEDLCNRLEYLRIAFSSEKNNYETPKDSNTNNNHKNNWNSNIL